MKVLISINTAWNLVNFRAGLIRALINAGHDVVAVAPPDAYVERVRALGCRFVPLPMDNKGTNPIRDLLLLIRFIRLMRRERPDVYLGYTVKPNVYGSIAANLCGISVINNIAGLGSVFVRNDWLTRLVRRLYALALSRSATVFFQNEDDRAQFIEGGLVNRKITDRLPGSGVDLSRFEVAPMPSAAAPIRFLLIARMLWEKGVGEYVETARQLRRLGLNAEFCLLGFLDVQNPAAISREQMDQWCAEGVITYLGETDDVRPHIAAATCIVLPSYYREGVPRSLIEAAAMGRPIITTDAVGCREMVDDGVNGYLCKPRDALDLAAKMEKMIALSPEARAQMGGFGRQKVERGFDEKIVIKKYFEAIAEIGNRA